MTAGTNQYYTGESSAQLRVALSEDIPAILANNILHFGGDPTGVNDNTVAMNAAHATGQVICYPAGTYKFAGPVTIAAGGIQGAGRVQTNFTCTDSGSGTTIICAGINAYLFADFQIGTATKTGGAAIAFTGDGLSGNTNTETDFDRVTIFGFPTCISFVQAAFWSVRRCFFAGYTGTAIKIQDTTNIDGGDSIVGPGCVFQPGNSTGIGVTWLSAGGFRVMGNKFLGGASAVSLVPTVNGATVDIYIHDNSIENQVTSGITMNRASGTMTIAGVQIYDNQMFGIAGTNILVTAASGTFISNLSIRGNTLEIASGQSGISVANANNLLIAENQLVGGAGVGIGIIIGASCTGGTLGVNGFSGVFTAKVSNSGAAVFDLYPMQAGAVTSGNTGTGYGTLFSTTGSVVFPSAYSAADNPPIIETVIRGGTTAVAVIVTSISSTGFNYTVVSAVTGQTVTFVWVALGNY